MNDVAEPPLRGAARRGGIAHQHTRAGEAVLMANVARRFHLRSQSKQEIAASLGISRFKVARLLDTALSTGVVRIQVGLPGQAEGSLGQELKETFGLAGAMVLEDTDAPGAGLMRRLGQSTLELLGERLTAGDVLGLASARPLLAMGEDVSAFPRCPVVQLTGAVSRPDAQDIIQTIRALTQVGGGRAHVFYAPIIGAQPAAVARQQHDVRQAFDLHKRVTVAVIGIGAWVHGLSTIHDALDRSEREAVSQAGVTTEAAGILMDDHGRAVDTPLAARLLTPTLAELLHIPTRVGVVIGAGKASAVITSIRSGAINHLITHRALAEEMLAST